MNTYTKHTNYVLGFHGCDKAAADRILNSSKEHLKPSKNNYDWLGSGIYFWLNDPERALEWAKDCNKRNPNKIKTPAVIGAIIDLGTCLNLTERECVKTVEEAFSVLGENFEIKQLKNKAPDDGGFNLIRPLDCAVINLTCDLLEELEIDNIDTVLGVFQEGKPIFEGSDILAKTHTQISVRNQNQIVGYFLPRL